MGLLGDLGLGILLGRALRVCSGANYLLGLVTRIYIQHENPNSRELEGDDEAEIFNKDENSK